MEVTIMNNHHRHNPPYRHPRGQVPPFFISLETDSLILHNCMLDNGATNNILPLSIMEAMGLECTKYFEVGEGIFSIYSRIVLAYGEIKYFLSLDKFCPHINTIFTIIVVDLPLTYLIVLG